MRITDIMGTCIDMHNVLWCFKFLKPTRYYGEVTTLFNYLAVTHAIFYWPRLMSMAIITHVVGKLLVVKWLMIFKPGTCQHGTSSFGLFSFHTVCVSAPKVIITFVYLYNKLKSLLCFEMLWSNSIHGCGLTLVMKCVIKETNLRNIRIW